jgi:hypothetical protein
LAPEARPILLRARQLRGSLLMKTNRTMNAATVVVLSVLAVLMQNGCATKPNIRADYDHSADFAKYRTFNFASPLSTDKLGYSSLVTQQLKSSVTAQMEQRGYKLDPSNPDLLVNFSGKLQEKQEIESAPGPYYGYRSGFYGAWPGYAMGNEVYTVNYTEGTLNVDMVDASRMQMVWEGVIMGEIKKEHLQNREATIDKAVAQIFTKYPFQAGTAQPIATAEK